MQEELYDIKRAIYNIERNQWDKESVIRNLDRIIEICNNLKSKTYATASKEEVLSINLRKINTLPFIYKPIMRKNYFEGTYLEKFSEARTKELKEAGALDIHNEFWKNHQPIKGNIFGSVPKELLDERSVQSLFKSQWKEVMVDIYDIFDVDLENLIKYCDKNVEYYILINEKSTSSNLLLVYNIN